MRANCPHFFIANTISRVLYSPEREPLSFIYDCNHLQPLATYPPTLDEQPLIVGIHGLATRKAYCQTTLLPLRWALTPPFHPYPDVIQVRGGLLPAPTPPWRLFSVTLLYPCGHRAINSYGALCCSDFPLPLRAAIERTCHYFSTKGYLPSTRLISLIRNCVVTVPR